LILVAKLRKEKRSAADFLPVKRTFDHLRAAAETCKGCDLYKNATQTVFGEGPVEASVVFIGEQPGDFEDKAGHPFVGPAGRMFDKALDEARLSRKQVYITNAVKHFKWKPQGKRRKHQKPLMSEIMACKPWLKAELDIIQPKILVCMGGTAAQSVVGKAVLITKERGKFIESDSGPPTLITIHPSAIYRHPSREEQEKEYRRFVFEMKLVQRKLVTLLKAA
jgi:uracil-DNA glycosylase family protein